MKNWHINTEAQWKHHTKWQKARGVKSYGHIYYEASGIGRLAETESRPAAAGGWEKGVKGIFLLIQGFILGG